MTSFIPNRKPDTPVSQLITSGNYQSKIDIQQFKKLSGAQGPALSIFERNKRPTEEIQIKPITQNKVQPEHYNPKHYLTPLNNNLEAKDLQISNLQQTRVFNRKLVAGQISSSSSQRLSLNKNTTSSNELPFGIELGKGQFQEARKFGGWSGSMSTTNMMSGTGGLSKGNLLAENRNYISQNENEFYKSNKIFYKPSTSYNKYSYSTPDYLKTDQKAFELTKTGQGYKPGETFGSRNSYCLTVDPNTMSRKNAQYTIGNMHKTSHISPSWMQTDAIRDEEQLKLFKPFTVKRQNVRCESNRLFLADKQEPPKSIFNLGQIRHNLLTKDDAQKQLAQMKNYSTQPVRLLEWKENTTKQPFDLVRITGKIGQNY